MTVGYEFRTHKYFEAHHGTPEKLIRRRLAGLVYSVDMTH